MSNKTPVSFVNNYSLGVVKRLLKQIRGCSTISLRGSLHPRTPCEGQVPTIITSVPFFFPTTFCTKEGTFFDAVVIEPRSPLHPNGSLRHKILYMLKLRARSTIGQTKQARSNSKHIGRGIKMRETTSFKVN